MTQASKVTKPESTELPLEIMELAAACDELPADLQQRIQPLMCRVLESTRRRRRILTLVQDALSQLRLDMKYLMFDLEATRRERDDYKRQLEQPE
jgi:hypothetical protein